MGLPVHTTKVVWMGEIWKCVAYPMEYGRDQKLKWHSHLWSLLLRITIKVGWSLLHAQFGQCLDLGCASRDSFSYVLVCYRRLCVLWSRLCELWFILAMCLFVTEDYVCYACGILSDYLPKKVAEELANSYRWGDALKVNNLAFDCWPRAEEPFYFIMWMTSMPKLGRQRWMGFEQSWGVAVSAV